MPRTKMDNLVKELNAEDGFNQEEAAVEQPLKKRIYKNGDMVKVSSVVAGVLVYSDEVTGNKYTWPSFGDVEEVEYSDLLRMIKKRQVLFKPSAIVLDKDLIEQNKTLSELYASLYTPQEIREILSLDPASLKAKIESLPGNVKENVKDVAIMMIDQGELDSVAKIKVLDELFGTKLLMKMAQ
jgi:hypothetical protein